LAKGPGPGRVGRRWIILAAVVALVVVIAGTVFALTRQNPSSGQPVGTATPPPSTVTPSGTVPPTPTPTATPTLTPTPTPTPTKEQTPYCKAFSRITAGGVEAKTDEGSIDFPALSANFSELIRKYSAAAELAPASLKADYAKVLSYLEQGKKAVDQKDKGQLIIMVKNLGSLNDTMANIQNESKAICG
jgi:hypothetical protein